MGRRVLLWNIKGWEEPRLAHEGWRSADQLRRQEDLSQLWGTLHAHTMGLLRDQQPNTFLRVHN